MSVEPKPDEGVEPTAYLHTTTYQSGGASFRVSRLDDGARTEVTEPLVRFTDYEAMRERAERAERRAAGLEEYAKRGDRRAAAATIRAEDAESKLAEVERARDEALTYRAAVRAAHNGYDPEARSVMPHLREPESPAEAIEELREEAEAIGRAAAEAQVAELRKALEGMAQHFGLWPEVIPRPIPVERDAPRAAIRAMLEALASTTPRP